MTISKEKHLNFLVGLDELGRHSGNHGKWLHILRHHRTACRRERPLSCPAVFRQPGRCKFTVRQVPEVSWATAGNQLGRASSQSAGVNAPRNFSCSAKLMVKKRCPLSNALISCISSFVSEKSNTSKFSRICFGLVDFGKTT